jgi:hypothetical protein
MSFLSGFRSSYNTSGLHCKCIQLKAFHGRINPNLIEEVFDAAWGTGRKDGLHKERRDEVRFLMVGTKKMMKVADKMVRGLGYPMPDHALLLK